MGFWYVTIIERIGKGLLCHFFDNYGYSKIKMVRSMRLLKKKIKQDGRLRLVDSEHCKLIWKFNNLTRRY